MVEGRGRARRGRRGEPWPLRPPSRDLIRWFVTSAIEDEVRLGTTAEQIALCTGTSADDGVRCSLLSDLRERACSGGEIGERQM